MLSFKKMEILKLLKMLSVLMLSFFTIISHADDWDRIAAKKKIVVGLDDTFVPMGFRDKANDIVGFDVDLAKAVFEQYGITVEFQPITWSMKETELNNKLIDLIWNGYTINEEREKKVLFSKPYIENQQVLVTQNDTKINSFKDMKDKALSVQLGSSGEHLLETQPEILFNLINQDKLVRLDSFNLAFIDLKSQRTDAILVDNIYGNYYIDQQSDKDKYKIIHEDGFSSENFAVGMRKDDVKLKEKIDQAFTELYKEGKMQKISKKWFGKDIILPQQ